MRNFRLWHCRKLSVVTCVMFVFLWAFGFFAPKQQLPSSANVKKILFWNSFFSRSDYYFGLGHEPFVMHNCSQVNCFTSNDRSLIPMDQWDAIVFHGAKINPRDLPSVRTESQQYIFVMLEAPTAKIASLEPYNNFFNWTATYRSDSDIPIPYSQIIPKLPQEVVTSAETKWLPETPYEGPNVASRKSQMVAIFMSNCDTTSRRELLVEELSKYISVHVYGYCGYMTCSQHDQAKCRDMLDKHYKFYLAFENALCREYVTEKFFSAMEIDVVPVVYGGADYSSVAPPHSYIDAQSFPSVEKLAEYLKFLDQNDDMYNQYFWWKKHYRVDNVDVLVRCFCKLCEMLHEHSSSSVWKDIRDWWVMSSYCIAK